MLFTISVTHLMTCALLYSPVTSIHSIHKIIKIRNSETLSKLEGGTEGTTVQDSRDREIKLRSRKI